MGLLTNTYINYFKLNIKPSGKGSLIEHGKIIKKFFFGLGRNTFNGHDNSLLSGSFLPFLVAIVIIIFSYSLSILSTQHTTFHHPLAQILEAHKLIVLTSYFQ